MLHRMIINRLDKVHTEVQLFMYRIYLLDIKFFKRTEFYFFNIFF